MTLRTAQGLHRSAYPSGPGRRASKTGSLAGQGARLVANPRRQERVSFVLTVADEAIATEGN